MNIFDLTYLAGDPKYNPLLMQFLFTKEFAPIIIFELIIIFSLITLPIPTKTKFLINIFPAKTDPGDIVVKLPILVSWSIIEQVFIMQWLPIKAPVFTTDPDTIKDPLPIFIHYRILRNYRNPNFFFKFSIYNINKLKSFSIIPYCGYCIELRI